MQILPMDPASRTSDPVRMGIKRHSRCLSAMPDGPCACVAGHDWILVDSKAHSQRAAAKHTPDDHDTDSRPLLACRQLEMDVWAYNEVRCEPNLPSPRAACR